MRVKTSEPIAGLEDQVELLKQHGVYNVVGEGVAISVSFCNGEVTAIDGLEVDPRDAVTRPAVVLFKPDEMSDIGDDATEESYKEVYYTVIMFNPDAPLPGCSFLSDIPHWVVWNCKLHENVHDGDTVLEYIPPGPHVGVHRYVFLVCEQLNGYEESLPPAPQRLFGSIPTHIAKHGLEVAGINYFVSRAGGIPKPNDILALTGARAIWAGYVFVTLFYKFFAIGGVPETTWASHAGTRGYSASIFFYVLSGFIIVWVYGSKGVVALQSKEVSTFKRDFWYARVARIAPLYFTSIITLLPFTISVWDEITDTWPKPQNGLPCMVLTLTGMQAWSPAQAILCSNPLLSSISCLIFFYIMFPFMVVVLSRKMKDGTTVTAFTVCILGMVTGLSLWYGLYHILVPLAHPPLYPTPLNGMDNVTEDPANLPFGNPLVRLPEFMMGMSVGALYLGFLRRETNTGYFFPVMTDALTGLLVFVLGMVPSDSYGVPFFYNENGVSFGLWYWVVVAVIPLWILGLAMGKGGVTHFVLTTRIVVWLGERSHAFFTIQFQVLTYAAWACRRGGSPHGVWDSWQNQTGTLPSWSLPFLLLTTICIAALLHTYIEVPFKARILKWAHPDQVIVDRSSLRVQIM
eukprot:TRINITY_DN23531_c0_g1_i1.p1 TRINITY_DN23531_c0_g1~~TRINITY_DN23531_c0_g1_i1.p1  ORF type:complete len:630 (+),score=81.37 TRINITY_DN23531_c0_g1_i1:72-1961(+)